jgi:hypothetical protein
MDDLIAHYLNRVSRWLWLNKKAKSAALTEMRTHLTALHTDTPFRDLHDLNHRFGNARAIAHDTNASAPPKRLNYVRIVLFALAIIAVMELPRMAAFALCKKVHIDSLWIVLITVTNLFGYLAPVGIIAIAVASGAPRLGLLLMALAPTVVQLPYLYMLATDSARLPIYCFDIVLPALILATCAWCIGKFCHFVRAQA